jgi:hypothetical protein
MGRAIHSPVVPFGIDKSIFNHGEHGAGME